jgi:hypothetical protein
MVDSTEKQQAKHGSLAQRAPWKKGGPSPNPAGRPKGSRNKFSEDFIRDFCAAWEKNGADALDRMARDDPSAFVRAAVQLLPAKLETDVTVMPYLVIPDRKPVETIAMNHPKLIDVTTKNHD